MKYRSNKLQRTTFIISKPINNKQQVYLFDVNFNLQSLCLQLSRAIRGGHKRKKK